MTQAGLLGEAVDQLARLAVLIAGRQLQRGQLLRRVLVQHQAFVHRHGRREAVFWGGERDTTIYPKADSNTRDEFSSENQLKREKIKPKFRRFQGALRPG